MNGRGFIVFVLLLHYPLLIESAFAQWSTPQQLTFSTGDDGEVALINAWDFSFNQRVDWLAFTRATPSRKNIHLMRTSGFSAA